MQWNGFQILISNRKGTPETQQFLNSLVSVCVLHWKASFPSTQFNVKYLSLIMYYGSECQIVWIPYFKHSLNSERASQSWRLENYNFFPCILRKKIAQLHRHLCTERRLSPLIAISTIVCNAFPVPPGFSRWISPADMAALMSASSFAGNRQHSPVR